MKYLMPALFAFFLTNCGSEKPSPGTAPAPTPSPSGGGSMPACSAVPRCVDQCFTYYPHETDQAITAECNRRGLLYSGVCTGMLNDNRAIRAQYTACIAKPVTHVISYP